MKTLLKILLKSTLFCFTIVAAQCVRNKDTLKNESMGHQPKNTTYTTDQRNASLDQNKNQDSKTTESVSVHTDTAEKYCKQAAYYLSESKQALGNAQKATTQSELEQFKKAVQKAADEADEAAKAAEKAAQAAADHNTHDVKQAAQYAQNARESADDALKNVEKVDKIQLPYYSLMYNATSNSSQSDSMTSTLATTKKNTKENAIKRFRAAKKELAKINNVINEELTSAIEDCNYNMDDFKEKNKKLQSLEKKVKEIEKDLKEIEKKTAWKGKEGNIEEGDLKTLKKLEEEIEEIKKQLKEALESLRKDIKPKEGENMNVKNKKKKKRKLG
ncbi:hypothetical protein [Cardinium endosymbiont of Nabis limbatus]|uniref:hypothetical protein n=1 Tax=Cardinium endosymbiont of Nabis limbatus TaxID=3066217 RepID=UPI003AF38F06